MYLKKLKIKNFRKFGTEASEVGFVDAKSYRQSSESQNINVAPTTTLIVGKNNSGKTSITKALDKLINEKSFNANDFNFPYLKSLFSQFSKHKKSNSIELDSPYLEFSITIGMEDESSDLVTNLVPFMTLKDIDSSEIEILIKYELSDEESFKNSVIDLVENNESNSSMVSFRRFLELIDSSDFKLKYYNISGDEEKFSLNDLIEIKAIKANNIESTKSLSTAFSKIVKYRYKSPQNNESKIGLEERITKINSDLTSDITNNHTKGINESLGKIESADKLKVLLSADLTFEKLMNSLIRYEYIESDLNIPENQFGLGYTNLMMIIAELIDYMERYPENSFNSKVNLISIEEPETFMHPQMQELFIKHINEAITSLLFNRNKNVNSQLIITTHSSHILNSKIHSGNTLNNINYITSIDEHSEVIILNDDKIKPDLYNGENSLKFLKKHIKYKVSELFFSDAIIFVEGVTEETILRFYLDKDTNLNKYYISIFNIDGAHGLVYHELIKHLKVPALIITDLDIKRSETEKNDFSQVSSLTKRETTNATIMKYQNNSNKITSLPDKIEISNMRIVYQGKISDYYATSFEEAFILSNYDNAILNSALKKTKPNIYEGIVGDEDNKNNIKNNSFKLQCKLKNNKTDFANNLLFQLILNEDSSEMPILPDYVSNGLDWIKGKLIKEKK